MLFAITNTMNVNSVSGDVNPGFDINDIETFTFDTKYVSDGTVDSLSFTATVGSNYTYFAIAGHNLGTIGATITITNHGVQDVFEYAPIDDRVLYFSVPARSGISTDLVVDISKPTASQVVISHAAAGFSSDLTTTSLSGQVINTDYQSGYARLPYHLSRKIRSTVNDQGAPTAVLVKSVSAKMKLSLNNVPTEFVKTNLVTYQRFWINNGFFIQDNNQTDESYMAFNFIPTPPKTHSQVRELVNLSWGFMGYNGL